LRAVSTVQDVKPSTSKPGSGVVTVATDTVEASGEVVQRLVSRLFVAARTG
jgi:acyl dehydratase